MRILALLLVLLGAASTASSAPLIEYDHQPLVLYSQDGDFNAQNPNSILAVEIFVPSWRWSPLNMVRIQTWGYGGGVSIAGTTVPAGGFDPIIALFEGPLGSPGKLLGGKDDGPCPPGNPDPSCWDAGMDWIGLPVGYYTVTLTAFANIPAGPNWSDGFTGHGTFVDMAGRQRTTHWALDVWEMFYIPEPLTLGTAGAGLLTLGLVRRRWRK